MKIKMYKKIDGINFKLKKNSRVSCKYTDTGE